MFVLALLFGFQDGGSGGLTIDWTLMPTYNTIMAVAAGAGLILVVRLARALRADPRAVSTEGYALAFGILGLILTLTGAHMTLTWPLAPYFPYDNIIFGEPSLGFGVLLLGAVFYGWTRCSDALAGPEPEQRILRAAEPTSVFVAGLGLGLLGIAAAGMVYQLFAAPPAEPITGLFAAYPWVEATFISGLYALVGVGAVAFPWAVRNVGPARRIAGTAWTLAGWVFLLFGAFNYFTHIGLIVNTM